MTRPSEIAYLGRHLMVKQYILRLQISMNKPVAMNYLHTFANLQKDSTNVKIRHLRLLNPHVGVEVSQSSKFEDNVDSLTYLKVIKLAKNIWMVDQGLVGNLVKHLRLVFRGILIDVDSLQRTDLEGLLVLNLEDLGVKAFAKLLYNLVPRQTVHHN